MMPHFLVLKLSASHLDGLPWPTPTSLEFATNSLVSPASRSLLCLCLSTTTLPLCHYDHDTNSEKY